MEFGVDWDLLNVGDSWIPEVRLMHQLILQDQQIATTALSEHINLVPKFVGYKLSTLMMKLALFTLSKPFKEEQLQDQFEIFDAIYLGFLKSKHEKFRDKIFEDAHPLLLMNGPCCSGKTAGLESGEFPFMKDLGPEWKQHKRGIISADDFKQDLRKFLFEDFTHNSERYEGLLHVQSMALCDMMVYWACDNHLPVIIDKRFFCPIEVQRHSLMWTKIQQTVSGVSFKTIIVCMFAEVETLMARAALRSGLQIDESVVKSGNQTQGSEMCVLFNNSSYEIYCYENNSMDFSPPILFVECLHGEVICHNKMIAEKYIFSQSWAKSFDFLGQSSNFA